MSSDARQHCLTRSVASVLAWITQVIPSVYGSWNTARGSSSSVSKGIEWPDEGFAKCVTCNSNSDSVCMDLCLSSLSVHGSANSHSATMKQHPCLRLNWNARKKAECRQEPFRKRLLYWAQVSNKNLPVAYQNLKTAPLLPASSSLWLLKAQPSSSAFVSYDWGEHDFFPSLPLFDSDFISPILHTYRWAPPRGASGLSWRCCTAHTAEACLPWDLATTTVSTSWRAV